jgi:LuxR family transcriptional regulator, maltose regulon positive regulatory protein
VPTRLRLSAERSANQAVKSAPARRRRSDHERPAPAFELLESKLLPPQGPAGAVSREALIDVMERATAVPVVLLSAGPGWGKTTLLAEWAARSSRSFAWLNIDDKDNDPIVLLTYVATAVDRVAPIDARVFEALTSPGASVEGTIVPRLGAALATADEPLVLVLDDLHLLHDRACLDAVATLARHVRDGSQLALSARGEPALPLAALRARGLELDLGREDLRMDTEQAGLLLRAAGVELPDAEVAELVAHTEGWAAGLYLAALSIRARGLKGKPAASFSGSDFLVSDYLQSELLAQLSGDELRFLTRTSVLDRLSGPLCDAVLEESASASALESLARSNLFLVPLDRAGEWYRYHHLLQELLRAALSRAEPDRVPGLLARAAEWCAAHGEPERAIGYAQQAGDVDRVARLVEQCVPPAYQSGRVTTAERWFEWLEARGALEQNPLAAVLGSLLATLWGRPAEAERRAQAAELASHDGGPPDGSASVDSWLVLLRAHRCQRGVARMRADAELALELLAPGSRGRPHALLLLGVSRLLTGEIDQADDLFADAVEAGLELGTAEEVAAALGERAAIAVGRDAWVQAEELANQAHAGIRRSRMEDYPTSALVYAVAARVALRRGEAQRVDELLSRAQRLRPQLTYAMPWISVQARLELARAYLTMADAGGAETMLRELAVLLRRQPDLGTLSAEVQQVRSSLQTMRAQAPGASTLTEAELRVLPYLATHLSFREIAERLFLSRHTVKSHAMAIYHKLSVTSRSDAVERAGALGLL